MNLEPHVKLCERNKNDEQQMPGGGDWIEELLRADVRAGLNRDGDNREYYTRGKSQELNPFARRLDFLIIHCHLQNSDKRRLYITK
jgi:hypothetical protein